MSYYKRTIDALPLLEHLSKFKQPGERFSALSRLSLTAIDNVSNRTILCAFFLVYAVGLIGISTVSMSFLAFVLFKWTAHWYFSLLCHSAILHRYASHRSFEFTSRFWEACALITTYLSHNISSLMPKLYRALHMDHHAFSDTIHDSHAPKYFNNFISMMIYTAKKYASYKLLSDEEYKQRYGEAPGIAWLDKISDMDVLRILWAISLFALELSFYWYFDMPTWSIFAFIALTATPHYLMSVMQGIAVNWFGHEQGDRRHLDVKDNSHNTFLNIILMGEGNQNNHHKNQDKVCFCEFDFWKHIKEMRIASCFRYIYEIDPTYVVLLISNRFGITRFTQNTAFAV